MPVTRSSAPSRRTRDHAARVQRSALAHGAVGCTDAVRGLRRPGVDAADYRSRPERGAVHGRPGDDPVPDRHRASGAGVPGIELCLHHPDHSRQGPVRPRRDHGRCDGGRFRLHLPRPGREDQRHWLHRPPATAGGNRAGDHFDRPGHGADCRQHGHGQGRRRQ
ncbi:hypothetical protein D3C87_1089950 [compost metagenome]